MANKHLPKPVRMWGGFMNGRLHTMEVDTGWGGFGNGDRTRVPAIFATRAAAAKQYQDVRLVYIGTEPTDG